MKSTDKSMSEKHAVLLEDRASHLYLDHFTKRMITHGLAQDCMWLRCNAKVSFRPPLPSAERSCLDGHASMLISMLVYLYSCAYSFVQVRPKSYDERPVSRRCTLSQLCKMRRLNQLARSHMLPFTGEKPVRRVRRSLRGAVEPTYHYCKHALVLLTLSTFSALQQRHEKSPPR